MTDENSEQAAAEEEADNENGIESSIATTTLSTSSTATPAKATKEKRSWFSSLTRRKKQSQSQQSLNASTASTTTATNNTTVNAANNPNSNSTQQQQQLNNNNEPIVPRTSSHSVGIGLRQHAPHCALYNDLSSSTGATRKRKDEKNAFQRFRKKLGLHFHSLRQRKHAGEVGSGGSGVVNVAGASGTQDASAEFLTHSPIRADAAGAVGRGSGSGSGPHLTFSFTDSINTGMHDEPDLPFTHDYKRFIVKKWLEHENGPNRVMYKACSEMLGQVWYWGEISRRDAQKQLTDKPTGSFLVRDSETVGSQFTLSFRIVNVTLHYRLEYRDNYWHFEELQYESIVEMIEDILYRCTNDNFVCFVKVPNEMQPPFPVILKYPLSRYLKMPTLQDLCRRVIQRHTGTCTEINKLPIPTKLQEYLSEKRELVFQC